MTYKHAGIEYKTPEVFLLNYSDPVIAEYFGRTAYDSFDKSENEIVHNVKNFIDLNNKSNLDLLLANNKKNSSSKLLEDLSHVYHHESVLEHINLSFFIKGISRGVLQELARHRIASYTVKSTRYTLSNIINSFVLAYNFGDDYNTFYKLIDKNCLVTTNKVYNNIVFHSMYMKLKHQLHILGKEEFFKLALVKEVYEKNYLSLEEMETAIYGAKSKRNVGDSFKHCIDENLSVDLGFTVNLRSLKNFLELRLSGAAWFQIQLLANEIYKSLPENLKTLIDNPKSPKFKNRNEKLDEMINDGLLD